MLNIIMGLIFVIGGLTGQLALRGLNSPELLAAIGAVMIVWGISQVVRKRRLEAETRPANDAEFIPPEEPR
ncbi:MAG: hypothetical protein V4719_07040 [Planctomycetota bacterium]